MDIVVGDVAVRVNDCPELYVPIWGDELDFVCSAEHPDIVLEIQQTAEIVLPADATMAFDARPLWSAYRPPGRYLLVRWSGEHIGQLVEVDPENWTGVVRVREEQSDLSLATRALRYPLFLLLVTWRVTYMGGLMLHACGVGYAGRGITFCGRSDAGKTTTARLWLDRGGAIVLNDDRVVVRSEDDGFTILGTPWYGDGKVSANAAVPLSAMLFLRRGQTNTLEPVGQGEAMAEVFASALLPFYDPEAMEHAFATISRMVQTVPTRAYHFLPDGSAVDFIQDIVTGPGLSQDIP